MHEELITISINFSSPLQQDGSKTLFKGNPCSASHDNLLKSNKVQHRGPLKRMVWDHERLPSTKEKIRELLHDFVNQLVSGGYNGTIL